MQAIAPHVGRLLPRLYTPPSRLFSVSRIHWLPANTYGGRTPVTDFFKWSKDPLLLLVDSLDTRRENIEMFEALQDNKVSMEEFKQWEPVLFEPDIDSAVSTLQRRGYLNLGPSLDSHENVNEEMEIFHKSIPSWVVLALINHRVKDSMQATGSLMELLSSTLESVSPTIKGAILISATFQLARFNLFVPLRQVLTKFLSIDFPNRGTREGYFNFFLKTVATISFRSVENHNNVECVIKTMDERGLRIWPSTYNALLNDQFLSVEFVKVVFNRLMKEDFRLSNYQLEALLRIFAKHDKRHRNDPVGKLFRAIHRTNTGELDKNKIEEDPRIRANTLMINHMKSRQKAVAFLQTIADSVKSEIHNPPNTTVTSKSITRHSSDSTPAFVHKPEQDIVDTTSAFHVAAKDRSLSTKHFIELFMSLPGKPTIVTHTIFIRGLLIRKSYPQAQYFWSRLFKASTFKMDLEALTVGVQAYTRCLKPHEAFQLLENYAKKPGQKDPVAEQLNAIHNDPENRSGKATWGPIELTTISMNEYFVSLNRIRRPDAVLRLFDHMYVLYGTLPNSITLSILIQSARLALKLDDSLSGAIAKLGLINPFRSRKRYTPKYERNKAVDDVLTCIGHPGRGNLRVYKSGIWRDMEPVDYARKVFLQALFGMDPDGNLFKVESPASAVRKSYDDDASSSIGFPDFRAKKYIFEPFPDLFRPNGKSWYPQIIVTNANCFNYITLIGLGGRANEIPLALAWMKALKIQPSESTLAISLVFWSEISVQAPLVEKWNGGRDKSEYHKFKWWLKDWVGVDRIPNNEVLNKWRKIIFQMRTVPVEEDSREGSDHGTM